MKVFNVITLKYTQIKRRDKIDVIHIMVQRNPKSYFKIKLIAIS